MPTVSQAIVLQSFKIPCPELFEQNIAPRSKFTQTGWLNGSVGPWQVYQQRGQLLTLQQNLQAELAPHFRTKKLMEIFNPIRPNLHTPNNWHLRVYCHGGCGLVKASVPSK